MLTDEYSAGFFDGEGTVYAGTRNSFSRRRPCPIVLVCITNTNEAVLLLHKEKYGGSIYGKKRREGHQPIYQWVLGSRQAYPFLRAILPHCVIKKEVIQAALGMCDLLRLPAKERNDYSNRVYRNGRYWVSPIVKPEFKAKVEKLHDEIKRLNKRGAPYNATRQWDA